MPERAQFVLALVAMAIMGALATALIFHAVPSDNRELVALIIGAIAGALTLGGMQKAAHTPTPPAPVQSPPDPQ